MSLAALALLLFADPSVPRLARDLSSDSWKVRKVAYDKLDRIGLRAYPLLAPFKKDKDPGTRMAATTLCDRWEGAYVEATAKSILPAKYDKLPWIDMLSPNHWNCLKDMMAPEVVPVNGMSDARAVSDYYLSLAYAVHPKVMEGGYDWPRYRLATYLYVKDLVKAGVPREQIVRMLDAMVPLEWKWDEVHQNRKRPEI